MKIAICEDEKVFSDTLTEYIHEWANQKNIFTEIFAYNSAESFLYVWSENEDFDLIFLDIKMSAMTGVELAKLIRKTNDKVQLIFTTNMKEYVFAGYGVSAMQYLLKPISKKECFLYLDKVSSLMKTSKYYIYQDVEKIIRIPLTDIHYIKMVSHYATIYTSEESYVLRKTVAQVLDEINDVWFVKCHKSYIVNVRHIDSISKTAVIISGNTEIPVSKNMVDEINKKFIDYNTNRR